jgi:hypothetical protein
MQSRDSFSSLKISGMFRVQQAFVNAAGEVAAS